MACRRASGRLAAVTRWYPCGHRGRPARYPEPAQAGPQLPEAGTRLARRDRPGHAGPSPAGARARPLPILASIAVLALTACAPAQPVSPGGSGPASAPVAPKKIVGTIGTGDPQILRSNAGGVFGGSAAGIDSVEGLVNAGTVDWNTTGVLHPVLAKEVPGLENGLWKVFPDGRMQTTWNLHPN